MNKNCIILFFALVLSTLTFAQNINAIEPELQNILNQRNEELIDIQIYFKSNINSDRINQASRKAQTKSEKKEIVVGELKTYSENVQADVMNILKAEELSGNVADIRNLWIANTISCKASKDVIYKLSSHPDVKIIGYDKEIQMISPKQMENIEAKPADVRGPFAHVVSVNADDVWAQGYTGKNVVVAVLDSGTNTNHIDLADHLWLGYVDTNNDGTPDTYVNGWNYVSDNSNITDDFGHGTHCAGIVCGDGTSGNTTGVAPDAYLMTLKTVNRAGGGSVSQMLSGVQFAVENGADVLSMSLGFKNSQLTTAQKEEIRKAFDNVLSAGVIVCAAAGNDGDTYGAPDNVDYPAACPAPWRNPDQTLEGGLSSVICVGAHDLNESSRGPSTWEGTSYNDYPYNNGESMGLIRPDISAPGYFIYSLKYTLNDKYDIKSGTSQATPCVAGVIALMLEKNPTLTPAQISQIIEETAASKPEKKNNTVGAGIVDALAAVNSITEVVGNPYVKLNTFAPATISTGNSTIGITLKNEGNGPSEDNTTVTLSLANDPYVTIVNPSQTAGKIGVNDTKTLFFNINVDKETPSGHTAAFTVTTKCGTLSWEDALSVNITTAPNITFQTVSPAVVKPNATTDISVTIVNNGTAAFTDPIKLNLTTIPSDLKYVTLVDSETTIPALGVGEAGTGTFTIETKEPKDGYKFDFFLETYSEYTKPTNYVYEFNNDMQGWTSFNASSNNNISKPWWHSSEAVSFGKEAKDSHSGNGHLMSNASLMTTFYNYPINNYLVSPVKVKVTENSSVSFYARAHNKQYYQEHFGLAVSTAGNTSANDFTLLQEWVITDKATSTEWKQYTVDLSAYAGQEIYVAIRHFFTAQEWEDTWQGYDLDALNIDDIVLNNVIQNTKHTSTYSYDDPYYFNVMVSNSVNLPMVENLTATAINSSKISLTWDAANTANSYNVYRNGQKVATVTETAFVDSKLSYETQYCYAVTTVSSYGESAFSEEACATTLEPTEAATPTNLTATADSESTIVLTWDAVEEAASYNVYQGTELIASELTTTMYIVNGLTPETEYCFSVTAVNKLGESEKSESACATTLKDSGDEPIEPEVPTLEVPVVTAEATSESTIVLTWNAVENAMRYNIYSGEETIKLAVTATTYTVSDLDANTQYCFNVVAVNRDGQSEKSADACATTFEAENPEPAKLDAPKNLRASIKQDIPDYGYKFEITTMWDAVEGATGYDVYVNTDNAQDFHMGYTNGTAYVIGSNEEITFEFYVVAFNDETESEPSEVYTVTVVDDAIDELTSALRLYPNPVNDKLYIETEIEIEEVVIYDVYGRLQVTETPSHQENTTIDVSEFNAGVYFMMIKTNDGVVTKRFVKE